MIRSLLLFFFISSIYAEPREGIDYPMKDKQDWLTNRLQASNFPEI